MTQFTQNIAVIIGINDYENGIEPLKTAVNDARVLEKILKDKYEYEIIELKQPTLVELRNLLNHTLPGVVKSNEKIRLLFYFAGHGKLDKQGDGSVGYIVPQDARRELKTFLPMQELQKALTELQCHHLLIILDCCFAGSFGWRDLLAEPEKVYKQRYDRFIEKQAYQAITSTAYDQKAIDFLDVDNRGVVDGHSPFALALIQALGEMKADYTQDGIITVPELIVYLTEELYKQTANTNRPQIPGLLPLSKEPGQFIFVPKDFEVEQLAEAPALQFENNPYRGLQSFEAEHSTLFFGREQAIAQLYIFICQQKYPFTAVLGNSGSGKSSLVKAGLIPSLKLHLIYACLLTEAILQGYPHCQLKLLPINKIDTQWHILEPMHPGESPFAALKDILQDSPTPASHPQPQISPLSFLPGKKKQSFQPNFSQDKEEVYQSLQKLIISQPKSKILLVIDQAEELFTQCRDQKQRQEFLSFLDNLVKEYSQNIQIVLTLSSEFEPQFQDHPSLKEYWTAGRFFIPEMNREELREAIEKPASLRVLYFEPPALIDRLIDEVIQNPNALPLLSFTLSELYIMYLKKVDEGTRDKRVITQADYEELGGVARSLTQRADSVYDQLVGENPAYEQTIPHVMLRMVATGSGELTRRRVLQSELIYPESENQRVDQVIKFFKDARLLTSGKDADGHIYVEPAHDALIKGWAKLREWKEKAEGDIFLQRRLTPDAEKWKIIWPWKQKNNQEIVGLWHSDPRLPLLQTVLKSPNNWLNKVETQFVRWSIYRKRFNISSRWGLALGVTVASTALTIYALRGQREAQIGRIRAFRQTAELSLASNQDLEATIQILRAAKPLGGDIFDFQNFVLLWLFEPEEELAQVRQTLPKVFYRTREHNRLQLNRGSVYGVAFSSKKDILATVGDADTVRLWDTSGKQLDKFSTGQKNVYSVAFTDDGKLATGAEDGTLKLWEIQDDNTVKYNSDQPVVTMKSESIRGVSFGRDNKLVTIGDGDNLSIWQKNGKYILKDIKKTPLDKLRSQQKRLWDVAFSQKEDIFAFVGDQDTVILSDISGNKLTEIKTKQKNVYSLAFNSQGQLATGAEDGTVLLWDVKSYDSSIEYELADNQPGDEFHAQHGSIYNMTFSRDGKQLITIGRDETVRIWNTQDNYTKPVQIPAPFEGNNQDSKIRSIAFRSDGKQLATVTADNTVRLWDTNGNQIARFYTGRGSTNSVAFSPNGRILAIAKNNGISLWDTSGDRLDQIPLSSNFKSIEFDSTGKELATIDNQGVVSRWFLNDKGMFSQDTLPRPNQFQTNIRNIQNLAFSPDGQRLATVEKDGTIQLRDTSGRVGSLRTPQKIFTNVAFSPDSQKLAAPDKDGKIWFWNTAGEKLNEVPTRQKDINTILFNPYDSNQLLIGGGDGTVRMLNLSSNQPAQFKSDTVINKLAFNKDNSKQLATVDNQGAVKVWKISGNPLQEFPVLQENIDSQKLRLNNVPQKWSNPIQNFPTLQTSVSIPFSSSGETLATIGKDGIVQLWNIEDGKVSLINISNSQLAQHKNIKNVAFSPDGQMLTTINIKGVFKAWDINGKELPQFPPLQEPVNSVEFNLNSTKLATLSEKGIELWDFKADGTLKLKDIQNTALDVFQQEQKISSIALSPDGKQLATITNGQVNLWDTTGKRLDNPFPSQENRNISTVAFSSDGNQLAIASDDGSIKLWYTNLEQLLAGICHTVRDYLEHNTNVDPSDRQLCNNIPETVATSMGDKILVLTTKSSSDKLLGVQAIKESNFPKAITHLETSLKKYPNDPEALIYLNNARIGNSSSHTIAISVPLSGNINGSLEMLRGVAQAQLEINQAGGINNVPLRVLIADDKNDIKMGERIAQTFSDNPSILGVVGHYSSDVTLAAGKIYDQEKLVAVSPVSTSVKLSNFSEYIFRTVPSDAVSAQALAKYVPPQSNVKIFYNSKSEYSLSLASEFKSAINKVGGYIQTSDLAVGNFNAEQSIQNLPRNTIIVLMPNTKELDDALEVVRAAKKKNLKILAGDDVYTPQTLQQAGADAVGMIVGVAWNLQQNYNTQFVQTAKTLWQADINWRTTMSYDTTKALIAAIQEEPTRKGIQKALRASNFTTNGATSKIEFLPTGDIKQAQIQPVQVQPGSRSRFGYDFTPVQ